MVETNLGKRSGVLRGWIGALAGRHPSPTSGHPLQQDGTSTHQPFDWERRGPMLNDTPISGVDNESRCQP